MLLRKAGHSFNTTAEHEVVRLIKEKTCYIALDAAKEEKELSAGGLKRAGTESFKLPDGQVIKLGAERFRAPEILFSPDIIGLEYPGIHQLIIDSVERVDLDLRKNLYSNIVLLWWPQRLLVDLVNAYLLNCTSQWGEMLNSRFLLPPSESTRRGSVDQFLASLSTFKKGGLPNYN